MRMNLFCQRITQRLSTVVLTGDLHDAEVLKSIKESFGVAVTNAQAGTTTSQSATCLSL